MTLTTTHKDLIRYYLNEGRTASNMAAALGLAEKDVVKYLNEINLRDLKEKETAANEGRERALEQARAS